MPPPPRLILSACLGSPAGGDGWAVPDPLQLRRLATIADRGGLDLLIAEPPADPLITASWLLPMTRRVGLVATVPATSAEPFHIARAFSAMDHLSGGRTGWLPVARAEPATGEAPAVARAAEFVAATEALWDSWDDDALVIDKASGVYLDSAKIRRVDFRGRYFQVMGPLNAARPRQGHPMLVQRSDDPLFGHLDRPADVAIVAASNRAQAREQIAGLRRKGVGHVVLAIACALIPGRTRPINGHRGLAADGDAGDIVDILSATQIVTGCDGFHLEPAGPETGNDALLDAVLSELRRRGRIPGQDQTLRARLDSPIPRNRYAGAEAP